MTKTFTGVHWMLATPFTENEEVDVHSISNLMEKAYSSHCEGVVVLGVTGESARLTDQERQIITKEVIKNANGMSVTVGTTAASTKATIIYSQEAEKLGASAVMISAPPMGKPNLGALLNHYEKIAECIDIPIVVQDYPQTSGVHMPPQFISQLAEKIPQVIYLKLEDPPTPTKITAIKNLTGDKLSIFGGLGGVFLLDELNRGSSGAMTGFAYPEVLVDIYTNVASGNVQEAENIFFKYLPMLLFEFQEGIGISIRKYALHNRGLISSYRVRHPGPELSQETKNEFHELLAKLEVPY